MKKSNKAAPSPGHGPDLLSDALLAAGGGSPDSREEVSGPVCGESYRLELADGVNLDLVWIEPGEFVMGSPPVDDGDLDDECPQTQVRLTKGFWLGKYPVTQGQWESLTGSNPSFRKESGLNAPVENVGWDEAMIFARKLTTCERAAGRLPDGYEYTLPSEAQWEYAARAGTTSRWCFGDDEERLGNYAWYIDNSDRVTHPVGQKQPNSWGLHDMHGNVCEWTRSWYGDYPGGCEIDYESAGVQREPVEPVPDSEESDEDDEHVVFDLDAEPVHRGGSWLSSANSTRSAARIGVSAVLFIRLLGLLGFRLALSPVPQRVTEINPPGFTRPNRNPSRPRTPKSNKKLP